MEAYNIKRNRSENFKSSKVSDFRWGKVYVVDWQLGRAVAFNSSWARSLEQLRKLAWGFGRGCIDKENQEEGLAFILEVSIVHRIL